MVTPITLLQHPTQISPIRTMHAYANYVENGISLFDYKKHSTLRASMVTQFIPISHSIPTTPH
ncbi:hypothetical protein [Marininema halotolerans]|uniref:Uncharacterized protein n=1 Tax=Marininema halotolerans TaxID=1155944 RepID=A0A1I6T9H8_9BACL|nr:hypothetical protein [Marininema halotolerans]SFS85607.1 hypothetical protein SAMN05444972_10992 [Marininema halotolerans]